MCVLPKLSHLAQAVPEETFDEVFATDLEIMMKRSVALCAGLQRHEHRMEQRHLDLASLPYSRLGGLNLQCPHRGPLYAPAILGSVARALKENPEKRLRKLCSLFDIEKVMRSPYITSLAEKVLESMTGLEKAEAKKLADEARKEMKTEAWGRPRESGEVEKAAGDGGNEEEGRDANDDAVNEAGTGGQSGGE